MAETFAVSVLSDVASQGLSYGCNYLVEFDPDSLWYETSLALTADALRRKAGAEYHTFMHSPARVRQDMSRLGLELKSFEERNLFRIVDSYTGLTGLPMIGESAITAGGWSADISKPTYVSDLTSHIEKMLKEGVPGESKRWLHMDDNTSMFNRHFTEPEILNIFQTRVIPTMRLAEMLGVHAYLKGSASSEFLAQFEAQCDGVFDFKSLEVRGRLERYVRVRWLRGRPCDSRWRRIQLLEDGGVNLDPRPIEETSLGIREWVRGPKK